MSPPISKATMMAFQVNQSSSSSGGLTGMPRNTRRANLALYPVWGRLFNERHGVLPAGVRSACKIVLSSPPLPFLLRTPPKPIAVTASALASFQDSCVSTDCTAAMAASCASCYRQLDVSHGRPGMRGVTPAGALRSGLVGVRRALCVRECGVSLCSRGVFF